MPGQSASPSNHHHNTSQHRYSTKTPAPLASWQIQQLQKHTATYPILVSDDDTMTRAFYRSLFQHYGLKSLETRDSREVLSICQQYMVGIILSDIQQPYMSGVALVNALRQHHDHDTASIPIVFVSGSSNMREAALRAGAEGFLCKPCHPNLILREIWWLLAGQYNHQ
ncbi:MAG: response regulator [Anaerolineae bacterium]|nr:response regulator [Anaerolineae bacterium]